MSFFIQCLSIQVDMIKELLRARQEAEAAEEAKFREEEERLEAIAAGGELGPVYSHLGQRG